MNLKPFRQSIGHLRAKLFKLAPAEQPYGQQEMEQLAAEIIEYGRMKQKHYGSHSVVLAAGELATRLRESAHTIVKALVVLREQGRAEETGAQGCWRLHFSAPGEQMPNSAVRELSSADELRR